MNRLYFAIAAVILFIGFILSIYNWHLSEVETALSQQREEITKDYNLKLVQLTNQKEKIEAELRDKILATERAKDAEIKTINSRHAADLARLRDRPIDRQTGTSSNQCPAETSPSAGATGLQLSRPDAEFLTWFARTTAELQAELRACMIDYDKVRTEVEKAKE